MLYNTTTIVQGLNYLHRDPIFISGDFEGCPKKYPSFLFKSKDSPLKHLHTQPGLEPYLNVISFFNYYSKFNVENVKTFKKTKNKNRKYECVDVA